MAHTETMLESKEIFNGRVIRVTVDKVQLEDGTTSTREIVHHHGGAIRHRKLFKVAPRAALRTAPRPGGIPFCRAVQLGHELVVAVERSLGDRQKERRIAQKPQVFFFRQHASPAHIAEVARQLQGEVPKPQRPR